MMNRKQRRTLNKIAGKEATSVIDLMLNMPTECNDCKSYFDKTNREMVDTWQVKVFKMMKRVELYCPACNEKRKDEPVQRES
jgi:hypothetical protein